MSGQASIATDTHDSAIAVPIQAVTVRPEKDLAAGGAKAEDDRPPPPAAPGAGKKPRREPLRKVVFVIQDGVAKVRRVETGLASETEIEIVSGLGEGEKVVEGPYRILSRDLTDGRRVTEEKPGAKGAGPNGGKR
jgi:HlyD family secretion protein